jgi:hypothetical protein
MIRHLRHHEIDREAWQQRLMRCGNRMWYVQDWVLDISSPGWEALVDDELDAMMPLTWRRKYFIKYLYQPYGTQQQGVFAPRYDDRIGERFLRALPTEFRWCDIALNEAMGPLTIPGMSFTPLDQQVIPLDRPIGGLRANYSKGHRRNLAKCADLPVVHDATPSEFIALFKRTTAARYNSGTAADHDMVRRLLDEACHRGQCRIPGLRVNGDLVAAAAMLEWEGRTIFFKSAADERGTEIKSMFRITDHYMEQHAGSGVLLDFAGSSTPSVARFNSGFGAQRKVYLRLRRNGLPPPFKWFKK